MIRQIKANSLINYALIFLFMLILWGFKFYYMPTPIETYEVQNSILPKFPEMLLFKYLSAGLAFVLLYVFAVFIIRFNSTLVIIPNAYQAPGIMFVILTGIFINAQRLLPETIASLIIFLSITSAFKVYKKEKAYSHILDTGIFVAISIFIYYKLIFLIPLLLTILIIIKPLTVKEIIIFFIGILFTLILGFSIVWLLGDAEIFLENFSNSIEAKYNFAKYTTINLFIFAPLIFLTIMGLLRRVFISIPNKVSTRKFQLSIIITTVVLLIFFLSPYSTNESIVLILPFLSLLETNIIINTKTIYAQITFWTIVIIIAISQIVQIQNYLVLY